ncbi:hypothetical protein BT93_H2685 [Corymbia citriodora subsp. variegata]|nr:hypothetical protein BT93_H2685 [Corymbia citriodora subsp. variegata]
MANRKYSDGPAGSTDNVEFNLSLGAEHEVLSTNGGNFASSLGAEFEVFLNFRGPDTRLNFADCLYHAMDGAGIHVFKDDEEIRKGEAIGDELEHAIRKSAICIPIFSRNYASSAWCLRELAYMIDCEVMILPIFFDVEPKDVKLKTELYHEALHKHKEKFGCEVMQRWKETLEKVACMEGWISNTVGGRQFTYIQTIFGERLSPPLPPPTLLYGWFTHGELIKRIVAEVSIKLNKRDKKLPDHLVGIQDHVEDVMHLMDEGSLDVQYIVIHGMGGIGKTTLAKIIFNQIHSQFHGCSFISNVREASKGNKIVQLQKQLLSEILNSNPPELYDSDAGIYQLSMRFCRKKVLIILDDLDERDQLSKLAEKHAFRMDSPPRDYDDISCEIALKANGLPLALEVIGSSLCRPSKRIWKDTLKKLDSLPNQKVHHKLKISFDMLDNAQREIFLDIACYFIGEKKIYPHYMWKALELYPKSNIIVLTHKSLIKVDYDDRLMMHDLLRKLGRDIVQQENKVSGKHSRLWCPGVALEVVQTKRVNHDLKVIHLMRCHLLTTPDFSMCLNLRILVFAEHCPESPQISSFISKLECLKHLGIIGAQVQPSKLCRSPHFDMCQVPSAIYGMKYLLSLKLEGQELPKSIGDLKRLEKMNLGYTRIKELPNSIGGLKSLLDLDLQWTDITTLPASIGHLKRLERLFMVYSKIRELHDSIGDLKRLEYTEITELPASIGHLKRLKRLLMYGSKIRVLPKAIGMLDNLEGLTYHDGRNIDITWPPLLWELDIFYDDPRSLPKLPLGLHYLGLNGVKSPIEQPLLSELRCLCELTLSRWESKEIEFKQLENLHHLDVDGCKSLVRTSGLSSLGKLERLSIFSCSQLMEIQDLEEMESLEKLSIGECNSIERLRDLSELHKLKSLSIMECKALQSLPDLPNSLEYLFIVNWSSIERLSKLSKLHKLRSLYSNLRLFSRRPPKYAWP